VWIPLCPFLSPFFCRLPGGVQIWGVILGVQ
jgi:hypothetical protein